MTKQIPAPEALPALLATQLMVAEVYSTFLYMSRDGEGFIWKRMLKDELAHVEFLRNQIFSDQKMEFMIPSINIVRMRETCTRVLEHGNDLFLLRLEGALRLEIAELDFSLEGLVAKKMWQNNLLEKYPGDIAQHIGNLITEAKRYAHSPNIGRQITRLTELYETSVSPTDTAPSP